ncbi:MAG: hypothetical protein L3J36_07710 [Rhodobacteraceae bacterium]|nr:hypothetical protein [Paracoccaceae bacterium]
MAAVFCFTREGRSRRTAIIVICIYAVLAAAIVLINAAWWLMALLALPTLPALYDLWRSPSAGVRLSDDHLEWHTGTRKGALDLSEIDYMRFDTRFDFSVRVTAILTNDKPVRLPDEAMPAHKAFETELTARGIRVDRHHFVVF